jgi:hypothetical protein
MSRGINRRHNKGLYRFDSAGQVWSGVVRCGQVWSAAKSKLHGQRWCRQFDIRSVTPPSRVPTAQQCSRVHMFIRSVRAGQNALTRRPDVGMAKWSPTSWEGRPIQQQPAWNAQVATSHISTLPPLVHPCEIQCLKQELQAVMRGERFLLQGGDCAERFLDCNATALQSKLRILLQMSLVLQQRASVPTVLVARIAGMWCASQHLIHPQRADNGLTVCLSSYFCAIQVNMPSRDLKTPKW